MSPDSARVDVLTAEVRALMVGKRQVTLSVYRQLDTVQAPRCEPFGRVQDPQLRDRRHTVFVVGRDYETGALVRSYQRSLYELAAPRYDPADEARYDQWCALPLIVLAGLR